MTGRPRRPIGFRRSIALVIAVLALVGQAAPVSAYDAKAIREVSARLGHKPIIDIHTRAKPKTQLPSRVKPQPELSPAEERRYKERTLVERVFGRLKDEFGAEFVRVRGAAKVMTHLMFGVLALTIDQTLRLHK